MDISKRNPDKTGRQMNVKNNLLRAVTRKKQDKNLKILILTGLAYGKPFEIYLSEDRETMELWKIKKRNEEPKMTFGAKNKDINKLTRMALSK